MEPIYALGAVIFVVMGFIMGVKAEEEFSKQKEESYKKSIATYEDLIKDLVNQNIELRKKLSQKG